MNGWEWLYETCGSGRGGCATHAGWGRVRWVLKWVLCYLGLLAPIPFPQERAKCVAAARRRPHPTVTVEKAMPPLALLPNLLHHHIPFLSEAQPSA